MTLQSRLYLPKNVWIPLRKIQAEHFSNFCDMIKTGLSLINQMRVTA